MKTYRDVSAVFGALAVHEGALFVHVVEGAGLALLELLDLPAVLLHLGLVEQTVAIPSTANTGWQNHDENIVLQKKPL